MSRAIAINGSPRMEKGHTALLLDSFRQGMIGAGCEVELFYASRLKVKACACGTMYCWAERPGEWLPCRGRRQLAWRWTWRRAH